MILIAIIVFVLAALAPKWILRKKYKTWYDEFSWQIPLLKLSGVLVGFTLAIILTITLTYSTKKQFIENKNAIYGLEFNSVMEEFGFEDGMKIVSINNEDIYRVNDIFANILMANSVKVKVRTELNNQTKEVVLTRKDIAAILESPSQDFITPIISMGKESEPIKFTLVSHNFSDVMNRLGMQWNQAIAYIIPSMSQKIGGFIIPTKSAGINGYGMILSISLFLLGILNLIPLPGFNLGNAIISAVEIRKRKYYNRKKKNVVGSISIALVILFLVFGL